MRNVRVSALIAVAIVAVLGLSFRLFSISIFQHSNYVALAQAQQTVDRDILPKRGSVLLQDLAGGQSLPVAESIDTYALSATPHNVKNKVGYAHVLAQASGVSEQIVLETLQKDALYMPPLKHGLSQNDVKAVAANLLAEERKNNPKFSAVPVNFDDAQGNIIYYIGGVFFIREYQRIYPEGGLLSQVLGFVNGDGVGRYGFEEQYNKELTGYAGRVSLQQDSVGTLLGGQSTINGADGNSYELSIDRNVQYVVERELADAVKNAESPSGSVIIMNPKNGEIIAMAGNPSFDPNKYGEVKSDSIGLFDNPTVSNVDEPGSVFKDIVMAAAIDQGVVTAETADTFPESVTVDGHKIETALRKSYGHETMAQVLANSDNVAMIWVANKLGTQQMANYIASFGFGSQTGIDLSNEGLGSVLPASKWRDLNRATIAFGQGISVTPIQLVDAYAAIANNGMRVQPHLVHAIVTPNGKRQEVPTVNLGQVIKPETSKIIRDMMVYTVQFAHNRAGTLGYKIGGKTGTAQIPDLKNGGYLADAYNHSFLGIGPSDDPKYVMLVRLDHPNLQKVGLFAESTAVPLFGKLSTFLLNYYQIPPTNK